MAAEKLEQLLKHADRQALPAALSALDRSLAVVLPALSQLPPETAPAQTATLDLEAIAPLLDQLRGLLQDHNFEATEVFATLQASLGEGPWADTMVQLQQEIDGLEFGNAQNSLQSLKEKLELGAKE